MADTISPKARSENMRRIRSRDTKPETLIRSALHRSGYRFRLHRRDLPGKPDIVFSSRRKVVFVHGCFWHQHADCREGRLPNSNRDYWGPKLMANVKRHELAVSRLNEAGWQPLTVWECEIEADMIAIRDQIIDFLGPSVS